MTIKEGNLTLYRLLAWFVLLVLYPVSIYAETITLERYLSVVRERHPFFKKEALSTDIEKQRQSGLLGDEDWVLRATPRYTHQEQAREAIGLPSEEQATNIETTLERKLWQTGGRVGLSYRYDFSDQQLEDLVIEDLGIGPIVIPVGPGKFYENSVILSYTQPLLRNAGGLLDRLGYELQGYTVGITAFVTQENQESFLKEVGIRFIDWALLSEERRITAGRLRLAEKELQRSRRKLRANLVDRVDVLRAKDAVLSTETNVSRVEARWKAKQAEIAALAQESRLYQMAPEYDLYSTVALPPIEQAVAQMKHTARILQALQVQASQLAHQRDGLKNAARPQLDLRLSGARKGGAESSGDAQDFDKTDYQVALEFRYPLRNRSARADVRATELERQQVVEELRSQTVNLEADVRNVLVQLKKLERTLALNREQINIGRAKTREEERLHNQGRTELTFVIQSRDSEAIARLAYARTAADYHKLLLEYRALMDQLLPVSAAAPADTNG